ncbi:hypothetical protein [Aestuariivirga litoralis]|uniref:hypothetical protein n=1 Tax=Aestuariivirga litoralis TaxID=2650924 RepID=UPI0018C7F50F|nr:hypothetical protein [Aestuariivirga litoralis]MBG1233317.1 hypothetical protein [Aestuariivirga litoralis]
MLENPQFWIGIAGLVIGLGLVVTMYRLEKRPRTDFRPRRFPTTLFLLIGMLIALGAAVHLLTVVFGFTIPQRAP